MWPTVQDSLGKSRIQWHSPTWSRIRGHGSRSWTSAVLWERAKSQQSWRDQPVWNTDRVLFKEEEEGRKLVRIRQNKFVVTAGNLNTERVVPGTGTPAFQIESSRERNTRLRSRNAGELKIHQSPLGPSPRPYVLSLPSECGNEPGRENLEGSHLGPQLAPILYALCPVQ